MIETKHAIFRKHMIDYYGYRLALIRFGVVDGLD